MDGIYPVLSEELQSEYDAMLNVFSSPLVVDADSFCEDCPNHPANGGGGICNCSLGSYRVIV